MKKEMQVIKKVNGEYDREETIRPLTNKELEAKIFDLSEIVKQLAAFTADHYGFDLADEMISRIEELQKDLQ